MKTATGWLIAVLACCAAPAVEAQAWPTKTIRLVKGQPEMRIEHTLENTGTKSLLTQQYNHTFFVMASVLGK